MTMTATRIQNKLQKIGIQIQVPQIAAKQVVESLLSRLLARRMSRPKKDQRARLRRPQSGVELRRADNKGRQKNETRNIQRHLDLALPRVLKVPAVQPQDQIELRQFSQQDLIQKTRTSLMNLNRKDS